MGSVAPNPVASGRVPAGRLLRVGVLAAILSAGANALVLAIASSLLGAVVIPPDGVVTLGQVVGASVAGGLRPRRLATVLETLRSPSFMGYPGLRRSLPPSTSPEDTGFNSRSYWRGPVWPVIDWLLWWTFVRAGEHRLAERVRESSLEQIAEGGFAEYFEPFTGEPLGSREQSWTAAVALDWLAHGPRREMRAA